MSEWYALKVISRQEAFVCRALGEVDPSRPLASYCPQHVTEAKFAKRKATRSKPLIPGYVFAQLPDNEAIHDALTIRGVFDFIPVPSLAVGALVLFEATHAFDETWKPPKRKGRRYAWKAGDTMRVVRGSFEGHSVTIVKAKGKARFDVLLSIFGRVQELNMSGGDLSPLDIAAQLAA